MDSCSSLEKLGRRLGSTGGLCLLKERKYFPEYLKMFG